MKPVPSTAGIVLVDDGELDGVVRVLEAGGLAFQRLRGGMIPDRIEPPEQLLIVTARRVEHVASGRGASSAGKNGLRIVAAAEESPALRRRLRRQGMQVLVRLPASTETWRLLIARALYQGDERRNDPRVATELPVESPHGETLLVDLSNRGCRIQTTAALAIGDSIRFNLPAAALPDGLGEPLALSGRVRRVFALAGGQRSTCAVVFDPDLPEAIRGRLAATINHWVSGEPAGMAAPRSEGPAIPAARLPSLPDLVLDDETDPPVRSRSEVPISLILTDQAATGASARAAEPVERADADPGSEPDRRRAPRGSFPAVVRGQRAERPLAVVGRDLSARGMRIERHPELVLGDRFRLVLHGPTLARPLLLDAAVVRDDAESGLALAFLDVARETAVALEKLVACLPDVESLEDGEVAGLGTVLSEILRD